MMLPELKATPKGTRIPLGMNISECDSISRAACYYVNRCNAIVQACDMLMFKYTEDSVRKYVLLDDSFKSAYIEQETKGVTNYRMKSIITDQVGKDFDKVAKIVNLDTAYRLKADDFGKFVTYNPTLHKPFAMDQNAINAQCECYLKDCDIEKYDMHRYIAALLTEFMGATIENTVDIADFFHLTDDGQVIPIVEQGFYCYPPLGNKAKI